MAVWSKFEDLILEFMEARVSELLDQGGVTSPKVRKTGEKARKSLKKLPVSTILKLMKNKQKLNLGRSGLALKQKRVCFALDDGLLETLDRAARITHVSRSFLVREVLFGWLNDRKLGVDP